MVEIAITSDASRDAGKKVLVVDDNRDAARMLQVLLKMQGCEVSIAHDGIEALAAAKASRPDVILMDLTLPRMSGVEVAEELRKSDSFAQTAIMAVSGHGADRLPQPSPFDGHLTKPVDLDRLLRLMAELSGGDASGSHRNKGF